MTNISTQKFTRGELYFDNAATMFDDTACPGNPSSSHLFGRAARDAVNHARQQIQHAIGAERPDEIVFTSGGTESDNMAIKGAAFQNFGKKNHIITSNIEHPAVLNSCKFLEGLGFKITYVRADREGFVDPEDIARAITDQTCLISIAWANNEIGTIQDIAAIGKIAREAGVLFHTDAVQAAGRILIDVDYIDVDLLSISGHKIGAPKGVGALYVRHGAKLAPLIHGGGQESGMRSGTENVGGIIEFGNAAEENMNAREIITRNARLQYDTFRIMQYVYSRIPEAYFNGPTFSDNWTAKRLSNNINICFPGIPAESLLLNLDFAGISASAGSACSSGSIEPSHVLTAIGLSPVDAKCCIRLTLGDNNSYDAVTELCKVLEETVNRMKSADAEWDE